MSAQDTSPEQEWLPVSGDPGAPVGMWIVTRRHNEVMEKICLFTVFGGGGEEWVQRPERKGGEALPVATPDEWRPPTLEETL